MADMPITPQGSRQMFSVENASQIIESARPILKRRSWDMCMMSALVRGAKSDADCVAAGWSEWLSTVNHVLFDACVGADDEDAAAYQFALAVAKALETPRDTDKARDLFLIARLDTGEFSALKTLRSLSGDFTRQISAVEAVVSLLRRRIDGEDVAEEMARAALAARRAARADIYYARATADAAYAVYVVYATVYADHVAVYAAEAAARDDLIAALLAS